MKIKDEKPLTSKTTYQVNLDDEEQGAEDEMSDESETEEEQEEEEYCFYRIESLLRELEQTIGLWPTKAFIHSSYSQASTLERGRFNSRIIKYLKLLNPDSQEPTTPVLNGLFQCAVTARKQYFAWDKTVMAAKSTKLGKSLEYVRNEESRFTNLRKTFANQRTGDTPDWMISREWLWAKLLCELSDMIRAELAGARFELESLERVSRLGRIDICSHLLSLSSESIKSAIAGTPLSRTPLHALAAWAHASGLVPLKDDTQEAHSGHLDKIKARLSRAKSSKARINILTYLLQFDCMGGVDNPTRSEERPLRAKNEVDRSGRAT